MKYLILALAPIAVSFACGHNDPTPTTPAGQTRTTSAQEPVYGPGYGGTTGGATQGWDNSASRQQKQPSPPVQNDSISR